MGMKATRTGTQVNFTASLAAASHSRIEVDFQDQTTGTYIHPNILDSTSPITVLHTYDIREYPFGPASFISSEGSAHKNFRRPPPTDSVLSFLHTLLPKCSTHTHDIVLSGKIKTYSCVLIFLTKIQLTVYSLFDSPEISPNSTS